MPLAIKHPKDFWTGIIFLAFGLSAMFIGRDYPMGTAGKMGPAYFPTVLGGLLTLIGSIAVYRSFKRRGEAIEKFHLKELFIVLSAVVLFGVLMRGAGLGPAAVVLIMISAYASPQFKWHEALLLAIGMAGFAVLVFVKLLGLPLQVFGPWLQF
ncbi:tripartite tricarboxylate transporter TctB family protein [Roseateles sp. PN1]|uniref:tripartite tricarboxylate transporter TctB family protein n=1 Tax=Roseateles sp. PN1 TaxID=3137372 RepID=UPI0031398060